MEIKNFKDNAKQEIGIFLLKDKLALYQEYGDKKVAIGSDAHRLNEIYDKIPKIDEVYQFNKGLYLKRKFISLNEK